MSQEKNAGFVTSGKTLALMRGTNAGSLAHGSPLVLGIGGAEANSVFVGDLDAAYLARHQCGRHP
ncbi:hypothetical protein [Glutamicibacter arilaitensis]|uniref:hypothetical protein n=1 Tax=Glutamicibacter arilaitensis TaxID=256701 RepID=UPI00384BE1D5